MNPRRLPLAIAAPLWLALFALALLTASVECGRRLDRYFLAGVVVCLATASLPFLWPAGRSSSARIGLALGLAAITVAVWVAGGIVGQVQIMCRLF